MPNDCTESVDLIFIEITVYNQSEMYYVNPTHKNELKRIINIKAKKIVHYMLTNQFKNRFFEEKTIY